MKFVLEINMDGSAFNDDKYYSESCPELARILKQVVSQLEELSIPEGTRILIDINGNKVGGYYVYLEDN